jgi:hypothetical protein
MVLGEADRRHVLGDVVQPQRFGVVDQPAQHALALRQVADGADRGVVHAGVQEPDQPAVPDHTECRVPRVDQLAGGVDDVQQQLFKIDRPGHLEIGAQQATQPSLGVLHVPRPGDELLQ